MGTTRPRPAPAKQVRFATPSTRLERQTQHAHRAAVSASCLARQQKNGANLGCKGHLHIEAAPTEPWQETHEAPPDADGVSPTTMSGPDRAQHTRQHPMSDARPTNQSRNAAMPRARLDPKRPPQMRARNAGTARPQTENPATTARRMARRMASIARVCIPSEAAIGPVAAPRNTTQ